MLKKVLEDIALTIQTYQPRALYEYSNKDAHQLTVKAIARSLTVDMFLPTSALLSVRYRDEFGLSR